jgi:hypothetical protein
MQAWEKCTVGEWNLSQECLTSAKTTSAMMRYLRDHEKLREEILSKVDTILGLDTAQPEPIEDDTGEEESLSHIPLFSVIKQALDIDVQEAAIGEVFCVRTSVVESDEQGTLFARGDKEDIWRDGDIPSV